MKLYNKYLGETEIPEEEIIYFPNGIIGFEDFKRFHIIQDKNFSPFCWLVSLDDNDFGIPLVNPFLLVKQYKRKFPSALIEELKENNSKFKVYCVVNLNGGEGAITVNLKGPILIDFIQKIGKQIILTADILSISYPLN